MRINIPVIWIFNATFRYFILFKFIFWVMDPLFSILNSLTHIFAAFLKRKYNPGLAFSLILGIPVALYALWIFYALISVPVIITIISIPVDILMHLFLIIFIRKQLDVFKT
ncbi:MAG: HXXEE domain-containing protein [Methanobacterium sp.]